MSLSHLLARTRQLEGGSSEREEVCVRAGRGEQSKVGGGGGVVLRTGGKQWERKGCVVVSWSSGMREGQQ